MTIRGIHPEGRPSLISPENRSWKRGKRSRGNPEFRFQVRSSLTLEHCIRRRRRRENRSPLVRLSGHSACRNHFRKKGSSPKRTQQDTGKNTKKSKNKEDQSLAQNKLQSLGNNVLIKAVGSCALLCPILEKNRRSYSRGRDGKPEP